MARKIYKTICQVRSMYRGKIAFYLDGYGLEVEYDGETVPKSIELSHYGTSKNFKTFEIIDYKVLDIQTNK